MKIAKLVMIIAFSTFFLVPTTLAAQVKIEWLQPDKYRDIDAGDNQSRKVFKERVFKSLDKHFAKLAEKLPSNEKLAIQVSDVDLAGDVHHGGIRRIRIIEDIFFPRIKFKYQLVDEQGKVIAKGEENLKDMGFMLTTSLRYQNDSFSYEKRMIDKWFKKTFETYIK